MYFCPLSLTISEALEVFFNFDEKHQYLFGLDG
jgi:hypothetical protein